MSNGKLYAIGVGPGDPELLTVKGMRILERVRTLCVPRGKEESNSLALSIVEQIVNINGKEIIEAHFPMMKTRGGKDGAELDAKWNKAMDAILAYLRAGMDVAFITLGDPALYSTFFYLYDRLLEAEPGLIIEVVPGVSSINAAALQAGIPLGLGDEKIAILPATYVESLKNILEEFDTVILMKVYRVFGKVLAVLNEMGIARHAIYVERAGMEGERVIRDITTLSEEGMSYFSLLIVRKTGNSHQGHNARHAETVM